MIFEVNHLLAVETKVFICVGLAFLVFMAASIIIGSERKARWFKKRTKYSFFTRRSVFGEFMHFGYPATREGYIAIAVICGVIGILCSVVYYLF